MPQQSQQQRNLDVAPQQVHLEAIYGSSTVRQWSTDKFAMVKTLQEARINHGSVDLMSNLEQGGRFVAVKKMPTQWVTDSPEEFRQVHSSSPEQPWCDIVMVKHLFDQCFPFVCEPLGVFRDSSWTYVVTDFANGGEIFMQMDFPAQPGPLREDHFRPLANQVVNAVTYLHEFGVAHRDLSPENVMVHYNDRGSMQVKLVDFGMATCQRICHYSRGKPSFQAPEMHNGEYDAFLVDAFQLGVVLYGLMSQEYPWTSTMPGQCQHFAFIQRYGLRAFLSQREVKACRSMHLSEVFTPALVDLLEGMLTMEPSERLTLGELCWREDCYSTDQMRRSVWDMAWFLEKSDKAGANPVEGKARTAGA